MIIPPDAPLRVVWSSVVSAFTWLDAHNGITVALLTAVLAAITWRYAHLTGRMAETARATLAHAREQALEASRLIAVFDLHPAGPAGRSSIAFAIGVRNIRPGPAIGVTISLEDKHDAVQYQVRGRWPYPPPQDLAASEATELKSA